MFFPIDNTQMNLALFETTESIDQIVYCFLFLTNELNGSFSLFLFYLSNNESVDSFIRFSLFDPIK